jgi:branched-chain amino acid aminotransferase
MSAGLAIEGAQGPVWLDGELTEWDRARLHVASFGLHNASCVFEGIRVYDGRAFALGEHCARLCSSARAIGMDMPYTPAQIEQAVADTIAASGHLQAYVRPVAWHGSEVLGISHAGASVHLAVLILPWPARSGDKSGVRLRTSRWARPAPHMAPVTAKASCGYVVGAMAHREATAAGFDDALLLDHRGYLAEATGANIFLVRRGTLLTPIADTFLAGITRRTVIQLASELGIEVSETRIRPTAIAEISEVFLTGTAAEVQSVRAVDSASLPDEHPVTDALAAAYQQAARQG